jgi:hypothetical protein
MRKSKIKLVIIPTIIDAPIALINQDLVKPNDKQQLAIAIMDLANNFDKAREIAIAGNNLTRTQVT